MVVGSSGWTYVTSTLGVVLVQCLPLSRLYRLQLVWCCSWLLKWYPLECLDLAVQLALETSGILAVGASGGRQLSCGCRPEEVE